MPSDRARVTYDPTRKWRGLIAQQGRVTVEADWNEATAIDLERDRQLTIDFVGPVGTPSTPSPGYVVTAIPQTGGPTGSTPGDLTIGSGTLYVGGERVDLAAPVTYSTQPEWLDSSTSVLWVPPGPQAGGVTELVYLLASEQEISAVEDPSLADVALGGPDTMQRLRIVQRFVRQTVTPRLAGDGLRPLIAIEEPVIPVHARLPIRFLTQPIWWTELIAAAPAGAFSGVTLDSSTMTLVSTAALQVSFQPASGSNGNGPAQLDAGTGYLGAENQLIRVMVASAATGAAPQLVWGFDDASFLYRVQAEYDSSTNQVTLTLDTPPIDSYHYPVAGQAVELLRDEVWLSGPDYIASANGFVSTVLTGYDATTGTVIVAGNAVDGSALPDDYLTPAPTSAASGPEIATLVPSAGSVAGGSPIRVTGSGFTGATAVNFGTTPASGLLVQSDTELTAITPGVSGTTAVTVQVTVITPLGTSNATSFDYLTPAAPAVTEVSPSTGVLYGGTLVTIAGSGFTGATEVDFGATAGGGLTVVSDTSLTVVAPSASAGEVTVTVITPQGNATGQFTYAAAPPPQVSAVSPSSGGLAGGTIVTVTGTAFTGATEVAFGSGNPGTGLSVLSDTELTVVSPAAPSPGGTATVDVTVSTPAGASPAVSGDQFTYQLEVTGVSPAIGPPTGGTVVTVTGAGFSGATSVSFGGVAGTNLTVQSDTQLTVTTPAGAGTVGVVVSAPGGSSPQIAAAAFSYATTPQLYLRVWQGLASPAQGSASSSGPYNYALDGTGVTVSVLSGSGQFHVGDFWRFAVRPLQPSAIYPPRYLTAPQPPDGPRTWICPLALLAWNADGTATTTSSVPVFWNLVTITDAILNHVELPKPVVTTISPNSGPPSGGTVVTLTGSGFTGATTVYFGPTTNPGTALTVQSDTQLTVTSPAGTGVADIRVITAGGESDAGATDQFAYIGVSNLDPALGPPGGASSVAVTGSGFTGATAVHFGSNAATNLEVISDTEVTVTSPAGSGVVDVTVTAGQHTSQPAAPDQFAYITVTAVNPNAGPQSGGTQVALTGAGFSAVAVTGVQFGAVSTTNLQVINDTTIVVTTPPGTGAVPVAVLTARGNTPLSGVAAPVFNYQGKSVSKDNKDLGDNKSHILDKHLDKATLLEKALDRAPNPVEEEQVAGERVALERVAPGAKEAEAKPPETAGGAGPDAAATSDEAAGESEAEEGHAFIEPDERPDVGGGVVAEDDA
jgi:hypothetical protein